MFGKKKTKTKEETKAKENKSPKPQPSKPKKVKKEKPTQPKALKQGSREIKIERCNERQIDGRLYWKVYLADGTTNVIPKSDDGVFVW